MKRLYKTLICTLAALSSIILFTACDDVKSDDRYILGETVTAERGVLLEDFTGQMCINCPDAHEVIKQLEEQYGSDKLIAVSIHCGTYGFSKSRTNFERNLVGLMTEEGNAILETYPINAFPMGVVNMGSPINVDSWATAVKEAMKVLTDVKIDLKAEYLAGDQDGTNGYNGTINVTADIISGTARTAEVQFWIIEDQIVAPQRTPTTTINGYVHDNVFRAQMFDGLKGTSVTFPAGINVEKTASLPTRWNEQERWEVNNLSIVAFVSDKTGVLQVVKVPLIEKSEPETGE